MANKSTAAKVDAAQTLAQAGLIPPESMANESAAAEALPDTVYFCGFVRSFTREGPLKYAVATGTIRDGKLDELKIDPVFQDLGNASHAVLAEFQRLAAVIP